MSAGTRRSDREFGDLLRSRAIRPVFQPLVALDGGAVVGYEALARGPAGTQWESPAALFGAAYRTGRVPELDWVCRAAAFREALAVGLHPGLSLFVNSEPASMGVPAPADLRSVVHAAENGLRVVMEVTERAIAADPAGLLAAVRRAREMGWGVALDDVGAEPASLAVMPFVRPDVIKLDLRLIQDRTTPEVASIVSAVLAQAERTGASILAEGIETERHVEVARAMGATLGQGWLFGRPGPLPIGPPHLRPPHLGPPHLRPPHPGPLDLGPVLPAGPGPSAAVGPAAVPRCPAPAATALTPFQVVAAQRPVRTASKEVLLAMSMHLEHRGADQGEPMVLLACFQEARHFTAATRRRFAAHAGKAVFTGAVGFGMPSRPVPGVHGGELGADDPLRGEWDVIAIGPHFAGALVAADRGDSGPDRARRFDYVITHDRDLVIEAARALLTRLVPG